MSLNAIQIISIKKNLNKTSKYVLDNEALQKLIKPVKDQKLALICIAGPSRMGKSFIMSYMIRFLSNHLDVNWIGNDSQPLQGFEWKTGIDPQTIGIWFSEPFVVQKSNGEEMAVILMDTQGVFDEESSHRDWSTIVGLSLLSSSCLIFNLMNSLQEDILLNLDSFLKYGLLAAKTDSESTDKVFQNLVFLIRDWNTPTQFKYGETGGKLFLEHKLEIKESQSETSKKIRTMLNQCFEDISCYLMPDPGLKAKEDKNFDGSVHQLSTRFVDKMKKFIINILNPEEIQSKTINNKCLSAQDLCQYLKTYVEVFNSEELPKPIDIVEATAKASDLILISSLKGNYLKQMRAVFQTKNFVSRKAMESFDQKLCEELYHDFDVSKKSSNNEILNELCDILGNNLLSDFKAVFNENESKREETVSKAVEECGARFLDDVTEELESKFVESFIFDELLKKHKKRVVTDFESVFGDENKDLFASHSLKLNHFIENSERAVKSENYRRIAEAEVKNTNAVKQSIEMYSQLMKEYLDKTVFVNKQVFKQIEKEIRTDTINEFKMKCTSGDPKFVEKFEFEFIRSLSEMKSDFKTSYKTKNDRIIIDTQLKVNNTLKIYTESMDVMIESIDSIDELIEFHEESKRLILIKFFDSCLHKDEDFLKSYTKSLEQEIDQKLIVYKTKLNEQNERNNNYYKNLIKDYLDNYIQTMDSKLSGNELYSDEELEEMHENTKRDSVLKFVSIPKPKCNTNVNQNFVSQLESDIENEMKKLKEKNKLRRDLTHSNTENLINEYLTKYEEKMEIVMKTIDSETELSIQHKLIRDEILEEFIKLNPYQDMTRFEPFVHKIEESIDNVLDDYKDVLELELKNQDSTSKALITDVKIFYNQEMDKYCQKSSFISSENLNIFNDRVIELTINKFECQRGNIGFEKYENMIRNSLIDSFNKIKEDNDMNTPTIAAIGIDLGTTNSCVAYYKPGKNGGNVIVIPNEFGKKTTPSVVSILDYEEKVGEVAKREASVEPRNTIFVAKRLIGRLFNDESVQKDMNLWSYDVVDDGNNNPKFSIKVNGNDETYFPEEISAKVVKKMKDIAEQHLGLKVRNAVITVPAYFNDAQKEATRDAGAIAGLNVLKVINEPTAAAIAFKLHRNDGRNKRKVLIYDFGGGTFDVAVLEIDGGNIAVLAVGGDNHLGGDDFDTKIVNYCSNEFTHQSGYDVMKGTHEGDRALSRLRSQCEEQKCNLSSVDSTVISIDNFFNNEDLNVLFTRDKFIELNDHYFITSMDLVQQTLFDAQIDNSEIDDIVLVGGSTRIPRIQQLLSDMFGGKQLNYSINPDEAVAMGAAVQAAILNGEKAQELNQLNVSDVCPMSLGVKVLGGHMSVIVPRNSTIPLKFLKQYVTTGDYQTSIDVIVYEGEEEMVDNNRELGKFALTGIPAALRGEQPVNVTFEINDEGILNVKAKVVNTGGEQEIEIKETKCRLSDQELQRLIEEAN